MSLASFPELKKLPRKQKLKLADELWQAGISDSMPVSPEQKRLLDSRWSDYQAARTTRISLRELDKRLKVK